MDTAAETDATIARIREKIAEGEVSLGPALSEPDLAAFEAAHGVTLPEAYRAFLRHLGDGGDGPGYGLEPLGTSPDHAGGPDEHHWPRLPDIARPFPFTRAWIWEEGEESEEGTEEQTGHGSVRLGTDGCGMDWHVIVTGPQRGHIWLISGEGITPTAPPRDFLRWYEDWLDGVESWWE